MEYKNIVKDFARRTRSNLNLIKSLQERDPGIEVYEVTQLVNSMLGLLVFPQQRYVDEIPKTPLRDLKEQGWPIPRVVGNYPQVKNLNQLVRYLRNAISHFNVEFISDQTAQIQGLRIWNEWNGKTTWKAELTIEEIDGITDKFLQLILEE